MIRVYSTNTRAKLHDLPSFLQILALLFVQKFCPLPPAGIHEPNSLQTSFVADKSPLQRIWFLLFVCVEVFTLYKGDVPSIECPWHELQKWCQHWYPYLFFLSTLCRFLQDKFRRLQQLVVATKVDNKHCFSLGQSRSLNSHHISSFSEKLYFWLLFTHWRPSTSCNQVSNQVGN